MVTGGIPALGDLDVWAPLALAGGLSVAVGTTIGLIEAKLRRTPRLTRRAPTPELEAAPTTAPARAPVPAKASEREAA
jgi:hypothetical protein